MIDFAQLMMLKNHVFCCDYHEIFIKVFSRHWRTQLKDNTSEAYTSEACRENLMTDS